MFDEVEDGNDVGVQASRRRAGLGRETPEHLVVPAHVGQDFRAQRLDRQRTIDLLVVPLKTTPIAPSDDVISPICRSGRA